MKDAEAMSMSSANYGISGCLSEYALLSVFDLDWKGVTFIP